MYNICLRYIFNYLYAYVSSSTYMDKYHKISLHRTRSYGEIKSTCPLLGELFLYPYWHLPLLVLAGGDEKKERESPVSATSCSWSLAFSSSLPQLEPDLFILLSRRVPISSVSSRSRGSWWLLMFSWSRSSRIWLFMDRSFWYDEHPWRIEAPVTDWSARVLRNGSSASAADE